ncbi:MAG: VOC family protein [Sporichthyaceae bacterium]
MGAPVVHFEILGRDQAALSAFYGEIFDWKVDANNPVGYGMVDRESNLNRDGIGIGGGIMGLPEEQCPQPLVTFYVEVPSVEDALAHAERLGGKRLMGPESPMEGLVIGMFADPEGHPIGVIQS